MRRLLGDNARSLAQMVVLDPANINGPFFALSILL